MAAKIIVKDNSNLQMEGDVELFDQKGNKFDLAGKKTIWLCRCGQSKNKPFCDGAHKAGNFTSEVNAK